MRQVFVVNLEVPSTPNGELTDAGWLAEIIRRGLAAENTARLGQGLITVGITPVVTASITRESPAPRTPAPPPARPANYYETAWRPGDGTGLPGKADSKPSPADIVEYIDKALRQRRLE